MKNLFNFIIPAFLIVLGTACQNNSLESALKNPDKYEQLDLINRQLTVLPPEIKNLKNLKSLYLNRNNLKQLPDAIGELQQLEILNLNNNQLDSLSPELGKLKNLESLSLIYNNIHSLPDAILNLKSLKYLNLCNNPVSFTERMKITKALPNTIIHFEFASQLNDYKGFFNLAIAQFDTKNFEYASFYCSKAIEINPKFPDAFSMRGLIECNNGNKDQGCKDLEIAVKLGDKQAPDFLKQFCK